MKSGFSKAVNDLTKAIYMANRKHKNAGIDLFRPSSKRECLNLYGSLSERTTFVNETDCN